MCFLFFVDSYCAYALVLVDTFPDTQMPRVRNFCVVFGGFCNVYLVQCIGAWQVATPSSPFFLCCQCTNWIFCSKPYLCETVKQVNTLINYALLQQIFIKCWSVIPTALVRSMCIIFFRFLVSQWIMVWHCCRSSKKVDGSTNKHHKFYSATENHRWNCRILTPEQEITLATLRLVTMVVRLHTLTSWMACRIVAVEVQVLHLIWNFFDASTVKQDLKCCW